MIKRIRRAAREEAAPTFPTWLRKLQKAKQQDLGDLVQQFVQMLRVVGTPMIDGPAVSFIYYDPQAKRVILNGEFNDWGRRGSVMGLAPLRQTGIFYGTLKLKEPARLEYKFVVDGRWTTDPLCPHSVDNGVGDRNSYFVVGDFRDPPELERRPDIPHGRVEEFDFESELLANRRRVYVYLPPHYDNDEAKRFATFYVHDGGEYLSRARLENVLDNLIYRRAISPLVAVMVDPVNRLREYRANEDYARFVESELIPHIDGRYRTVAERERRGVMGASLGGLISLYLTLSRPHLFSRMGGQSSAFFLGEQEIVAMARNVKAGTRFYFDVGKYEVRFVPAHQRLLTVLKRAGAACFFQELPGGHNWTSWRAHLKDLLTFLWHP